MVCTNIVNPYYDNYFSGTQYMYARENILYVLTSTSTKVEFQSVINATSLIDSK